MKEQRKYVRCAASAKVIIQPEDGSQRTINGELADISFIGMGVHLPEKIEEGIVLSFKLINEMWEDAIVGKGIVRYSGEIKKRDCVLFRAGIEFTDVDKKTIQNIINRLLQEICAEIRKKEQAKNKPSKAKPL